QCSYGKDTPRRPRTEAHYKAMSDKIQALIEYIRRLESGLEQCSKEHPNSTAQLILQMRPNYVEEMPESPEEAPNDMVEEEVESDSNDVVRELCFPTQNLHLGEEGGLVLHGGPSPFRYLSETTPPRPTSSRLWSISEDPTQSYTLQIDGANESHYNPSFDWSRHLPHEVPLQRKEHDKILHRLFMFFIRWCLRAVLPLFLRDMYRALTVSAHQTAPRLSHYSPMLHNAMLALGSAFSDDPVIRDLKTRKTFLNKALSYFEDECSRPHTCTMMALSLIGSFYSGASNPTLGFIYFGMSARVGQALGLGWDCSSWVADGSITAEDQVDRNWAYWTTVAQDVCWSLYVGREFALPSISKAIPIPSSDIDFDKNLQPGYDTKTFAATCRLLTIARGIMDVV
ncbi:Nitrogen assimilation transcription factor nit-4, partial [Leucoagaricus sp. SymC.cos]